MDLSFLNDMNSGVALAVLGYFGFLLRFSLNSSIEIGAISQFFSPLLLSFSLITSSKLFRSFLFARKR